MNDRTDLGGAVPAGQPSGRIHRSPASVDEARAAVVSQMRHLEDNCRIGLDVGYAMQCFDEAVDDYCDMVTTGEVNESRGTDLDARMKELAAECAELQAEAVVMEAMRRHLEDEAGQA